MFENHLEVSVLAWQLNKPRVMQVIALDENGRRVANVDLRLTTNEHGSFDASEPCRELERKTARDGIVAYNWVGWPTTEPHKDIVSWITVHWDRDDVGVYFEFFPEE